MINLRKMTEDEFRAFRKTSTADYAVDLMKGRNIGPEQALMEAEEEFDADLPDGPDTENSFMINIENGNGKKSDGSFLNIMFAKTTTNTMCSSKIC